MQPSPSRLPVQRFGLDRRAAAPARAGVKIMRSTMFDCLTAREYVVMQLLATGATNAQIARLLRLSEGTVRNAIARVTCKLGVADRTQAALLAYRAGLGLTSALMRLDGP